MIEGKRIIISRTDGIGDVILTLPLAGFLKKRFPDCHLIFLGRSYTLPVIRACEHIDEFVDWDSLGKETFKKQEQLFVELFADAIIHVFPNKQIAKLAKKSAIPFRIGTSNRWFHWVFCNKLVFFSRKKSNLHEAQLNFKLLNWLKIREDIALDELNRLFGMTKVGLIAEKWLKLIDKTKVNLIIHPKSKGSAREWGIDNYLALLKILPRDKYQVFLSGSEAEGAMVRDAILKKQPHVIDISGKINLDEFIAFIGQCDILIAASTGPLHIAAALDKIAIGLYAPMKPIHPGRWAPIGKHATFLVLDKQCDDCRKTMDCLCIQSITPQQVLQKIEESLELYGKKH